MKRIVIEIFAPEEKTVPVNVHIAKDFKVTEVYPMEIRITEPFNKNNSRVIEMVAAKLEEILEDIKDEVDEI